MPFIQRTEALLTSVGNLIEGLHRPSSVIAVAAVRKGASPKATSSSRGNGTNIYGTMITSAGRDGIFDTEDDITATEP